MLTRILTAVVLGLAVASHAALAQDTGTIGGDQNVQQQHQDELKYWDDLSPNYHNDDSPNYPFTA